MMVDAHGMDETTCWVVMQCLHCEVNGGAPHLGLGLSKCTVRRNCWWIFGVVK